MIQTLNGLRLFKLIFFVYSETWVEWSYGIAITINLLTANTFFINKQETWAIKNTICHDFCWVKVLLEEDNVINFTQDGPTENEARYRAVIDNS